MSRMDWGALETAVLDLDTTFTQNNVGAWGSSIAFKIAQSIIEKPQLPVATAGVAGSAISTILSSANEETVKSPIDRIEIVRRKIETFLTENTDAESHFQVLLSGIAALLTVIQVNYTGPSIPDAPVPFSGLEHADAIAELASDGELAYTKLVHPQYLILARAILIDNLSFIKHSKSKVWWSARVAFKHQELIANPAESLRVHMTAQYNKTIFAYGNDTRAAIEFGLVYHYYQDSVHAREYFLKAKESTGLVAELSGILGRRTKYQTFDTAQLVLLAQSKPESATTSTTTTPADSDAKVPERVKHEDTWDEASLPHANLVAADANTTLTEQNLDVLDQCIILTLCLNVKNENPRHGLTWEEMTAYIDRVLKNPNNWLVYSTALLIRARLEALREKTADRASMQLNVLVDQFNDPETETSTLVRLKHFFYLPFPARHTMEAELATLYLMLGIAKSALSIFERLEFWPEVIECYQVAKEDDKALEVIKERIAKTGETPEFLCFLGDLQRDKKERIASYTKAWILSKGRFSKAKRQLGVIAMQEQRFQDAIENFEAALAINPQQGAMWFRLGICGLATEDWAIAQRGFARVTALFPDDGEAWSNLATSFIRQSKLKEAYTALKEALRHSAENWRIWDNFVIICMKTGRIGEAVFALTRILDIKDKHVDILVLNAIVDAITSPKFVEQYPSKREADNIHKQLRELMGRLTSVVSNNAELWSIYAKYYQAVGIVEKAAEFRQREVRALQSSGWDQDADRFGKLVTACSLLGNLQMTLEDKNMVHASVLNVRSLLKKSEELFGSRKEYEQLKELYNSLEKWEQSQ